MRIASLYDCFDRHLQDLSIVGETEEAFVTAVVESFLVNMGGLGYHFTSHAEDTYKELRDEVDEMLKKKIYGHLSLDHFRSQFRERSAA